MKHEEHDGSGFEAVYRAADETTAELIRGLLEGEGIPVAFKSQQVPWMDGVMRMGAGFWGDILVPKELADKAREIIAAYESPETPETKEDSD
jgi:hypothetical protein